MARNCEPILTENAVQQARLSQRQYWIQSVWILAATSAAFLLYSAFVVPRLEKNISVIKPSRPQTDHAFEPTNSLEADLARWLPEGAWELERCKVLMVSGGTILFQDYQPRDDGTLEVFPFTMVVHAEPDSPQETSSHEGPPIVLRASERALLQFDRPLRIAGESAGKLKSGQLRGDVHLYRMADPNQQREEFTIRTKNVHMTPTRIYSLEDVEFQYGQHRGSGRHLYLDLQHDAPPSVSRDDFSRINGLQRLELASIRYVQLVPSQADSRSLSDSRLSPSGPLQITCRGPFYIDFQAARGAFEQDVFVQSLDVHGDTMRGHSLEFDFDRVVENKSQTTSIQSAWQHMVLRKIRLTGKPAHIQLASQSAEIMAEDLQYDLSLEQLAAADSHDVTLTQPGIRARAKNIQYRLRKDHSLGPMWAQGPGQFIQTFPDNPQLRTRVVQWQDQLTITPDGPQRRISTRGLARFEVEGEMAVEGKSMDAWLWETAVAENSDGSTPRYLPLAVVVEGDVTIDSPRLAGTTDQLMLRWPLADRVEWNQASARSEVQRVFRLPWSEIGEGASTSATPRIAAPSVPERRGYAGFDYVNTEDGQLSFSANQVRVWFDDSTNAQDVSRVEMDGQVILRQHQSPDEDDDQWTLTGSSLRLTPKGENLYHVHVRDQARLTSRQFELIANEFFLDQLANLAWAPGVGQSVLRTRATSDRPDQGAQIPDEIRLQWRGGIVFDGETIYFEDTVVSHMTQQTGNRTSNVLETESSALSLVLTKPVRFSERLPPDEPSSNIPATDVAIERITLVNHIPEEQRSFPQAAVRDERAVKNRWVVLTQSVFGESQKLLEYNQLTAPRIVLHRQQGTFQATGPGEITSWRQGDAGQPVFLQVASATPHSPNPQISYLHVEYDDALTGQDGLHLVTILGRVRVVQASASEWRRRPQIDLRRLPPGAAHLVADQVEISQWTPRGQEQSTVELIATGNARLRGETFEALAYRLSYNQRSDILEIEGGERDDAQLRYQPDKHKRDRVELAAQKIRYRPSDQWLEIVKARNATIHR